MSAPPSKEKAGAFRYRPVERLLPAYQTVALQQAQKQKFFGRKTKLRRCVICKAEVTNQNLGGYDGRSALTANLYCLACADGKGGTR
jgi:hypothetical protein